MIWPKSIKAEYEDAVFKPVLYAIVRHGKGGRLALTGC